MNASFQELSCLSSNSTDVFKRQVYPAAYILIFVLGVAGHSLSVCVFFSQWRTQKSFTPVSLLMVNLLVSDLMLVSSLPLRVSYYMMNSHWIFGHITCKVISYVYYLNMYSSVYFLVALNILRYLALVRPYLYIRIQTHYVAGIVCALIWLFMGLACSPLLFAEKKNQSRCLELAEDNVDQLLLINNVTFPVGFVFPLVVVIFCSVLLAKNLLRPSPALGRTRPCRKKACALVIISLGIFLVCFLPYHIVRTVFLYTEKHVQTSLYKDSCDDLLVIRRAAVIAHCLCTSNSCLDPILFFCVGENFRSFFAKWTGGRKNSTCTAGRNLQQEELQVLQN
ncbi:cysteinyl leukotriene receptor 2 [Puntigrus tetrazona]|uniref:cysteinyl leukotriene receptor 2 n=1 Tax=Puntigrus tetrazona TaxID=1606681 RepID=UPI001C8A8BCF|nr:cysteinyl leukotriene receptor 2 [Puntigrus tetrazona]